MSLPLTSALQSVTEALAAVRTRDQVVEVVLTLAVQALRAITGAMLLVDGAALNLVAEQGKRGQNSTIWQDGPLDAPVPAADVLRTRQPLFFEHAGALQAAYPELERFTGARASVASTVLPMFLDGAPLGSLILDFKEPHSFPAQERRFLNILAAQCAVALGRVHTFETMERQVEERTQALDAFARFTMAVGNETDVLVLAQQATLALRARFPDASVGYYEPDGAVWKVRIWTDDLPEAVVARLTAGVPAETPMIAEVLRAQRTVFMDASHAEQARIEHLGEYAAVANSPLIVNGTVRGVLSVGLKATDVWRAQDQAVIQAIEAGLNLALERAEQARQLEDERHALVAFMTFSERVGDETDVWALVQHAAKMLQETRAVDVVYFERGPEAFQARVWSDDFPADVLQIARQGYPLDQANLARAEREQQLVFEDAWDADEQQVPESVMYRAAAFQPFLQGGVMTSVLVMASQQAQRWTEKDKGIFRAVGRSLDLALKRAEQTQTLAQQAQQLRDQRDQLDTRTQELSLANEELGAFAHSVSHDLRTPVRHVTAFAGLARQALKTTPNALASGHLDRVQQAAKRMTAMIDAMLTLSQAVARELKAQRVDLPDLVRQAQRDVHLEYPDQLVRWRIEALPLVSGDSEMLQQVVTNLFSNAVKYSKTRPQTQITVWAEEREGEWAVFVQDNGVGFNPQYASRLFGVFQRLHSEKDFAGTGVGLATVRRIVLKHGGRVFAKSNILEGATFGFTLPKVPLLGTVLRSGPGVRRGSYRRP